MKYMLIILLGLVSCQEFEYSQDMYEEGVVTYMNYTPEKTVCNPAIDSDGDLYLDIDTIPEEYVIGFSCSHGGFRISNHKSKELFYNFRVGDEVIITYRQIDVVKKENDKEVERDFHGWDFVAAVKLDRDGPREK